MPISPEMKSKLKALADNADMPDNCASRSPRISRPVETPPGPQQLTTKGSAVAGRVTLSKLKTRVYARPL